MSCSGLAWVGRRRRLSGFDGGGPAAEQLRRVLDIDTTIVNPGSSAPSCSPKESTNYATPSIEGYTERNAAQREFWESQNGKQSGDPAKLAQALLAIADQEQPPLRFIAGADAIAQAEEKLAERQQQIDAFRELSSSLAIDES